MEKAHQEQKRLNPKSKQNKKDDILHIVEQFVQYFEKVDRGEQVDNSFHSS